MLERSPFEQMSHQEWLAKMEVLATANPAGATPALIKVHLESTMLLVDSLRSGISGQATVPHWTNLLILP